MNSVEEAYQVIANHLASRAGNPWVQIVFKTNILNCNCSSMETIVVSSDSGVSNLALGMNTVFLIDDACIFLRDDLLKTTGQRIWGLTFTLFPDGKFRIEYDYEKPDGYEETDETVEVNLNRNIPGISSSE